ncbi:hypothetical protein [Nocardia sp. NPDC005366]
MDSIGQTALHPIQLQADGDARSYEVRTFGCQMNVHDSERLSGL